MSKVAVIGIAVLAVIVAALYYIFRLNKNPVKEAIPKEEQNTNAAENIGQTDIEYPQRDIFSRPVIGSNTVSMYPPVDKTPVINSTSVSLAGGAQLAQSLPGTSLVAIDRPPVGGVGTSQSVIATPKQFDVRGLPTDIPGMLIDKFGNAKGADGDSGVDMYINGRWEDVLWNNSSGNPTPSWFINKANPECVLAAQQAGTSSAGCSAWQNIYGVESGKIWLGDIAGGGKNFIGKTKAQLDAYFAWVKADQTQANAGDLVGKEYVQLAKPAGAWW
jgi:hypothetical protein